MAVTSRDWALVVWGLLGIGVVTCLVATALSEERFPTLGVTVRRITASRVGRVAMVIGWMWLGWHAFAR